MRLQRKTPAKTLHGKLSGKLPYGKRPPRHLSRAPPRHPSPRPRKTHLRQAPPRVCLFRTS
mgnify:CR=1 FL=1